MKSYLRDPNYLLEKIIKGLQEYKETTKAKGVVLGLSGGKDSTVVAMLAKKVWGDNVLAVRMDNISRWDPNFGKPTEAFEIAELLKIKSISCPISEAVTAICGSINNSVNEEDELFVTEKALTNIQPRIRMTILYGIAQSIGYRVIGTGNFSEAYIGWTTKWGDSASDINPLREITCSEVIEIGTLLAASYSLPMKFVNKAPADGLTNRTDEDNFGFTYEVLDKYILTGEIKDQKIKEKIDKMHKNSEHKREFPYTPEINY